MCGLTVGRGVEEMAEPLCATCVFSRVIVRREEKTVVLADGREIVYPVVERCYFCSKKGDVVEKCYVCFDYVSRAVRVVTLPVHADAKKRRKRGSKKEAGGGDGKE